MTVGHPAQMVVLGSAGGDKIDVTVRDHQWVISSPSGFSTSDCTYDSPTTVECPHYSPHINLLGQGGDDRIKLKGRGDQIHGTVDGGQGADKIRGSDARNILQGGPGHDVIKGGRGNDEIYGDQGIDAVFGQRGNDLIYAQNHQRAERLDCGRGHNDTIYVDHVDPKPTRCEHVRFGSPY